MVCILNFFALFRCSIIVCLIVLFCVVGGNKSTGKGVNVGAMTSGGDQSVGGV